MAGLEQENNTLAAFKALLDAKSDVKNKLDQSGLAMTSAADQVSNQIAKQALINPDNVRVQLLANQIQEHTN